MNKKVTEVPQEWFISFKNENTTANSLNWERKERGVIMKRRLLNTGCEVTVCGDLWLTP